jgi:chromosome segregation ATPase
MTRAADVVRLRGDEYDRLMDEREILRQEAARAWREVDFIAKERTEHLEWRTKLANDLDECERMRDTLARTLNKRENDLMLLRNAVDAMMAPLGYHGTISARDDRVQAVMDALAHIDTAPARRASA